MVGLDHVGRTNTRRPGGACGQDSWEGALASHAATHRPWTGRGAGPTGREGWAQRLKRGPAALARAAPSGPRARLPLRARVLGAGLVPLAALCPLPSAPPSWEPPPAAASSLSPRLPPSHTVLPPVSGSLRAPVCSILSPLPFLPPQTCLRPSPPHPPPPLCLPSPACGPHPPPPTTNSVHGRLFLPVPPPGPHLAFCLSAFLPVTCSPSSVPFLLATRLASLQPSLLSLSPAPPSALHSCRSALSLLSLLTCASFSSPSCLPCALSPASALPPPLLSPLSPASAAVCVPSLHGVPSALLQVLPPLCTSLFSRRSRSLCPCPLPSPISLSLPCRHFPLSPFPLSSLSAPLLCLPLPDPSTPSISSLVLLCPLPTLVCPHVHCPLVPCLSVPAPQSPSRCARPAAHARPSHVSVSPLCLSCCSLLSISSSSPLPCRPLAPVPASSPAVSLLR